MSYAFLNVTMLNKENCSEKEKYKWFMHWKLSVLYSLYTIESKSDLEYLLDSLSMLDVQVELLWQNVEATEKERIQNSFVR